MAFVYNDLNPSRTYGVCILHIFLRDVDGSVTNSRGKKLCQRSRPDSNRGYLEIDCLRTKCDEPLHYETNPVLNII